MSVSNLFGHELSLSIKVPSGAEDRTPSSTVPFCGIAKETHQRRRWPSLPGFANMRAFAGERRNDIHTSLSSYGCGGALVGVMSIGFGVLDAVQLPEAPWQSRLFLRHGFEISLLR